MTRPYHLILAAFLFYNCDQGGNPKEPLIEDSLAKLDSRSPSKELIQLPELFTTADAEKILGEPAHLSDSSWRNVADTVEYKCSYTANAKDPKTDKTGNIYFMFEEYARESIAKDIYSFIKKGNENNEGVKTLSDVGDEAYFHSDNQNFYFILARKGNRMIRMKVNKVTTNTSLI